MPALTARYTPRLPADFLPNDAEGHAFQEAFQRAQVPGFETGCVVVEAGGQRVAVAPVFRMDLPLSTLLPPGWLQHTLGRVSLRIACVGHPSADIGRIDGPLNADVLAALCGVLAPMAPVTAFKGFGPDLPLPGHVRVRGLPVPVLPLAPDTLARKPSRQRSQLAKKRRMSESLDWQTVRGLPDGLVDAVYALYLQTYERAPLRFEKLNRAYFVETAACSEYLLAFDQGRLLGFAQLITGQGRMLFKYVGMDYAQAHAHGLYFGLLIRMVELAQARGLRELDFGVTAYDFKRRLGAQLHDTWLYYRHANPALHWLLGRAAPLLEPGPDELR